MLRTLTVNCVAAFDVSVAAGRSMMAQGIAGKYLDRRSGLTQCLRLGNRELPHQQDRTGRAFGGWRRSSCRHGDHVASRKTIPTDMVLPLSRLSNVGGCCIPTTWSRPSFTWSVRLASKSTGKCLNNGH